MSNIPDYIGGTLTAFLFGLPITKSEAGSAITSNCLKNTPIWETLSQFYTEYLLVSDRKVIEQLFHVVHVDGAQGKTKIETFKKMETLMRQMSPRTLQGLELEALQNCGLEELYVLSQEELRTVDLKSICTKEWEILEVDGSFVYNPLAAYLRWHRTRTSPSEFSSLLPRASIHKWLFALFFKIVLPVDRSQQEWDEFAYSPLNLTVFFRVLIHLCGVGYPAHWISEALVQIIEDKVITSARPPKSCPLRIEEAQWNNPAKRLSTAPFITEMKTLAAIFQPILPFSILSDAVPELDNIYEHKIELKPSGFYSKSGRPVHLLVFYNTLLAQEALGEFCSFTLPFLRQVLHPEFEGNCPEFSVQWGRPLQHRGVNVLTTFTYDERTSETGFWMDDCTMNGMREAGGWQVGLWRMDMWDDITPCRPVGDVRRGERWNDGLKRQSSDTGRAFTSSLPVRSGKPS